MIIFQNERFGCESCIRGHRAVDCNHLSKPLYSVRGRGKTGDKNHAVKLRLANFPNVIEVIEKEIDNKSGNRSVHGTFRKCFIIDRKTPCCFVRTMTRDHFKVEEYINNKDSYFPTYKVNVHSGQDITLLPGTNLCFQKVQLPSQHYNEEFLRNLPATRRETLADAPPAKVIRQPPPFRSLSPNSAEVATSSINIFHVGNNAPKEKTDIKPPTFQFVSENGNKNSPLVSSSKQNETTKEDGNGSKLVGKSIESNEISQVENPLKQGETSKIIEKKNDNIESQFDVSDGDLLQMLQSFNKNEVSPSSSASSAPIGEMNITSEVIADSIIINESNKINIQVEESTGDNNGNDQIHRLQNQVNTADDSEINIDDFFDFTMMNEAYEATLK